jgi:ribose transport system ATP-binding protein
MSGRSFDSTYPDIAGLEIGTPVLRVDSLASGRLKGVSFELRAGEIVGVGGLAGQGQRDLFLTLFGAQRRRSGTVGVGGVDLVLRHPRDAIRAGIGIAFVPEDRKGEGLFLPLSIRDNLSLATLGQVSDKGFMRRRAERAAVLDIVAKLRIGSRRPMTQPVGTLSGGNQQKVLIGRWLLTKADVLLLFDVTRGVDAATKHDIYELVAQLAGEGKAILLYSSETEEIANLCHRVLVMREGRISTELAGPVIDSERIVAASMKEAHDEGGA